MKKIYQLTSDVRKFLVGFITHERIVTNGQVRYAPKVIPVGTINVLPSTRKRILKSRRRALSKVPSNLSLKRRANQPHLPKMQFQEDLRDSINESLSTFRPV